MQHILQTVADSHQVCFVPSPAGASVHNAREMLRVCTTVKCRFSVAVKAAPCLGVDYFCCVERKE